MMKLAFFGDSITEGMGASSIENCYVKQVGEMLGAEVWNYGLAGTRIARTKNAKSNLHRRAIDFNLRTVLLETSADRIFVFGGTNDFGHGDAPMGEIGDYSPYTFHGSVNLLFSTLLGMYGKEKIVIILPLQRYNHSVKQNAFTGKYLKDYVDVLRYYVKLYGFKCIDLFENGLPEPPAGISEYFIDGLHPNDKGHKVLAEKICEFIKNDV